MSVRIHTHMLLDFSNVSFSHTHTLPPPPPTHTRKLMYACLLCIETLVWASGISASAIDLRSLIFTKPRPSLSVSLSRTPRFNLPTPTYCGQLARHTCKGKKNRRQHGEGGEGEENKIVRLKGHESKEKKAKKRLLGEGALIYIYICIYIEA